MTRKPYFFVIDLTPLHQIDWYTDFYYPLLHKWAARVRNVSAPEKFVFVEAIPNEVRAEHFSRIRCSFSLCLM